MLTSYTFSRFCCSPLSSRLPYLVGRRRLDERSVDANDALSHRETRAVTDAIVSMEGVADILDAYAEAWGSDAVPADELELYPGFYRLGHSEPVYWSFYICEKDTYNVLWHVEMDGKTGEPRG